MAFWIRDNWAKQELKIFENNKSIEKLNFTSTIFPLISAAPFHTETKLSAPSNDRAPLNESLIGNLTITKFTCIRNMYKKKETKPWPNNTLMKRTSSFGICQTMIHNVIMVVIYCYSERSTDKFWKLMWMILHCLK